MDADSRRSVCELAENSPSGIVAVITTSNNVSYLVGVSRKFGMERPLRLASASGASGKRLSDTTGESIALVGSDTSKAVVFTGEIPYSA